jgi:hypothetical protein
MTASSRGWFGSSAPTPVALVLGPAAFASHDLCYAACPSFRSPRPPASPRIRGSPARGRTGGLRRDRIGRIARTQPGTSDPLGNPRETTEPDSLGVSAFVRIHGGTVTLCLLPDRRQNELVPLTQGRRAGPWATVAAKSKVIGRKSEKRVRHVPRCHHAQYRPRVDQIVPTLALPRRWVGF